MFHPVEREPDYIVGCLEDGSALMDSRSYSTRGIEYMSLNELCSYMHHEHPSFLLSVRVSRIGGSPHTWLAQLGT